MSNETTNSTLTEIVNPEVIETLILDYALDKWVVGDKVRYAELAGRGSGVVSFPAWLKDTALSTTVAEGTGTLSNVALDTTEIATITAAQIGILRELTDYAKATVITGEQALMEFILWDGTQMCLEKFEDDLCALFTNASNSVGTSGSDMTIADFVAAMAKLDTAKARGSKVCVLDDQQAVDLRTAVAASTSTVFANSAQNAQSVLNPRSDAFVGELFGCPIWLTNLTDADGVGNVIGSMFIDARSNPKCTPYGVAMLWRPRVRTLYQPDQYNELIAITMAYGVGEILDFAHCKVVTDA